MQPLPAPAALDAYFLEARSKLLDVAAILDRIQRGPGADATIADARLARIREALELLVEGDGGRAERLQRLFSLDYDPAWTIPEPK